jgi:diphosphomevalonate decarboxylase
MTARRATAWAPVNIALIKHWGHGDADGRAPARASLSLTLEHGATTTVEWVEGLERDEIVIGGRALGPGDGEKAAAAFGFLRDVAAAAGLARHGARVASASAVPLGGGMASSAAGAAALCLAALGAAGLVEGLAERDLVAWCARAGSVSALRSLRGGAVVLRRRGGESLLDCAETAIELAVISCLVEGRPKAVSSSAGHRLAPSSPFFRAFVDQAPGLVDEMAAALAAGAFDRVGELAERDALAMHAVMLSCRPPVIYAFDATWAVWRRVTSWRAEGLAAYCTLDAGPNPHVLCRAADADQLAARLAALPEVQAVRRSAVSPRGAHLIDRLAD